LPKNTTQCPLARARTGDERTNHEATAPRSSIARFLIFPNRERVFKCGRTDYKMFEDIPKELHELRKQQVDKLKQVRKDGRRAFFNKTEPDELYSTDELHSTENSRNCLYM